MKHPIIRTLCPYLLWVCFHGGIAWYWTPWANLAIMAVAVFCRELLLEYQKQQTLDELARQQALRSTTIRPAI